MYRDTREDAIKAALNITEWNAQEKIGAVADRAVPFCWMVVNFTTEEGIIVYLDQQCGPDPIFVESDEMENSWDDIYRQFMAATRG